MMVFMMMMIVVVMVVLMMVVVEIVMVVFAVDGSLVLLYPTDPGSCCFRNIPDISQHRTHAVHMGRIKPVSFRDERTV